MKDALADPPWDVANPARGRADDLCPYDIAYLRGGTRELLKLRLLELVHAGYLIVREERKGGKIERRLAITPANQDRLLPMDKHLINEFRNPRTASDIQNLEFPLDLAMLCGKSRRKLIDRKLLAGRADPDNTFPKFMVLALVIPVVLVVTELARSFVAEPGLALLTAGIAAVCFFVLGTMLLSSSRTRSGNRYLRRMENSTSAALGGLIRMDAGIDEQQMRAVAVHGFSALVTSELDALALMFGGYDPRAHYGTQHAGKGNQSSGCAASCGG